MEDAPPPVRLGTQALAWRRSVPVVYCCDRMSGRCESGGGGDGGRGGGGGVGSDGVADGSGGGDEDSSGGGGDDSGSGDGDGIGGRGGGGSTELMLKPAVFGAASSKGSPALSARSPSPAMAAWMHGEPSTPRRW